LSEKRSPLVNAIVGKTKICRKIDSFTKYEQKKLCVLKNEKAVVVNNSTTIDDDDKYIKYE
jgi:hypothetical protein